MFLPVSCSSQVLVLLAVLSVTIAGSARAGVGLESDLTQPRVVSPGETYDGAIVMVNVGEKQEEVTVEQTDYVLSCDGAAEFRVPAGQAPRSNARWISLERNRFDIPPKGKVRIPFSVRVPKDATLKGSYWSLIKASVTPPPPPPQPKLAPGQRFVMQLIQRFEYGTLILSHLGSPKPGPIQLTDKRVSERRGERIFEVGVKNLGEWSIPAFASMEVFGTDGVSYGQFRGNPQDLHPDLCRPLSIKLTNLPPKLYKSQVVVDNGGDELVGATYDLDLR